MKKLILALFLFFPALLMAQTITETKTQSALKPLTEPLYILDGKIVSSATLVKDSTKAIVSIRSVDPSDIESITVLKGVKAVEKYGEEGKNGVVIFITKAYAEKSKKQ